MEAVKIATRTTLASLCALAIVHHFHLQASFEKGLMRIVGSVVGGTLGVVLLCE